jgi:hypothetical protein
MIFLEGRSFGRASDLFNDDVDFVSVLHVQVLGGLVLVETLTVEEESNIICLEALTLAVGIHQFLELSSAFDLEEDFFSVLAFDLQVQLLCLVRCRGRHFD